MRTLILQVLSVLLLILAVVWFIFEPGFEPVITAVAGLVGLFSAEFIKQDPQGSDPGQGGWGAASSTPANPQEPGARSIVVLPFENLSPDPENAFFADGLTEEIITDLSRIGAMRVISRTSALGFRGTTKAVPEIAKELNVRFALEGSVRREEDSLRITAQLIDAVSDTHIWAEKYTGTLVDVFDFQEKLSRRIVDALRVTLSPDEDRRLGSRPVPDVRAHDIWLRTRQLALSVTGESIDRAKDLAEQALSLQPDNALFNATLAWVHAVKWGQIAEGAEEELAAARRHASRAMELDSELPWSLFSMAIVRHREADLQEFVRLGKRVLEIERDSHTLAVLSLYLAHAGLIGQARSYAEESASLDPLSWLTAHARAHAELFAGNRELAFRQMCDLAVRLAPGEPWPAFYVGYAAFQAGLDNDAAAWLGKAIESGSTLYSHLASLLISVMNDDHERSEEVLNSTSVVEVAGRVGIGCYFLGTFLTKLGRVEEGIEWLHKAVERWFTNHHFIGEFDRLLASQRNTPGLEEVLARARKKAAALEA